MLKKIFSISIVIIAFGLLLSHELIPHHHHDVADTSSHEHEHDGEEHHHNILECFFSLLHHPEFNNLVLISSSVNNGLVKSDLSLLVLPFIYRLYTYDDPPLQHRQHYSFFPTERIFFASLRHRGPPLV